MTIEQQLRSLLVREQFDLVILESSYTGVFLDLIRNCSKAKVILRSHNIEHQLWRKRINQFHFLQRRMMRRWVKMFEKEEINLWRKVDAIISISQPEQGKISSQSSVPVYYIPSSVHMESASHFSVPAFYFIGAMDWEPNREAMNWFLSEIWPAFYKRNPHVAFHLAGKGLSIDEYSEIRGLVNHGFVRNSDEFLQDKHILINPLRTAQGIRIKALEAVGKGKVIISTQVGMEGLPFLPGNHYLRADSVDEFVSQMEFVLHHKAAVLELAENAQKVAQLHFSEEILVQKLEETFQSFSKPLGV
jgi:glycosyltransferase involved in cell wall biosynthesis